MSYLFPPKKEFLKKEFSEENIDFWVKCENYKKLATPEEMRKGADDIWNNYLDTSAMHQINVDNKARSHCKEALQNPNNTMFEMAQNQVYTWKLLQQLRLFVVIYIFFCIFSAIR